MIEGLGLWVHRLRRLGNHDDGAQQQAEGLAHQHDKDDGEQVLEEVLGAVYAQAADEVQQDDEDGGDGHVQGDVTRQPCEVEGRQTVHAAGTLLQQLHAAPQDSSQFSVV